MIQFKKYLILYRPKDKFPGREQCEDLPQGDYEVYEIIDNMYFNVGCFDSVQEIQQELIRIRLL